MYIRLGEVGYALASLVCVCMLAVGCPKKPVSPAVGRWVSGQEVLRISGDGTWTVSYRDGRYSRLVGFTWVEINATTYELTGGIRDNVQAPASAHDKEYVTLVVYIVELKGDDLVWEGRIFVRRHSG